VIQSQYYLVGILKALSGVREDGCHHVYS